MKYIRTKDGRIIDIEKIIDEEKRENPYYKDFQFDEIQNVTNSGIEDYCYIRWTAVGTEQNSIEGQKGKRVSLQICIDSPFIKQADTIEELIQDGDLVEFEVRILTCPLVAQIRLHSVSYGNGIELSVPGIAFGTKNVLALWIKLPNGDFHKVAQKENQEGKLKLL